MRPEIDPTTGKPCFIIETEPEREAVRLVVETFQKAVKVKDEDLALELKLADQAASDPEQSLGFTVSAMVGRMARVMVVNPITEPTSYLSRDKRKK